MLRELEEIFRTGNQEEKTLIKGRKKTRGAAGRALGVVAESGPSKPARDGVYWRLLMRNAVFNSAASDFAARAQSSSALAC